MADIIYTLEGGTYFNLTNKCPCNCAFCIRSKGDAVGDAKELWFDEEPTFDDIKNAIDNYDFSNVTEAVFCGYGEPTCAYDNLIKTAKEICENIDIISVSLNNPDSEEYDKITRNIYKGRAFDALIKFTKECVSYGNEVHMTVVDVISRENIEKSKQLCESLGAKFICRSFAKGR